MCCRCPETSQSALHEDQAHCWEGASQRSPRLSGQEKHAPNYYSEKSNETWQQKINKKEYSICKAPKWNATSFKKEILYLHFKADSPFVDAIGSSCTWPQGCKTFNGQRVSTIPVTRYLEVQIAIICKKNKTSSKVNNKPFKQILLQSRNIVLSLTSINGHKSVIKIFFLFLCWRLGRTSPVWQECGA